MSAMPVGEIEGVLAAQPGVREAAVAVREGRLIGYVVAHAQLDPVRLRDRMSEVLPDHMVPTVIIPLDVIDRQALPEPDAPGGGAAPQAVDPNVERVFRELFSEVLGVPGVGAGERFLELGGDSILAMRVAARAARHGLMVTPAQVLTEGTAERLAAIAGRREATPASVRHLIELSADDEAELAAAWLLHAWWALWLATLLTWPLFWIEWTTLLRTSSILREGGEILTYEFRLRTWPSLAVHVLVVPTTIVTALFVRRLGTMQAARLDN